jgi:hypothetical protein
VVIVGAGLEHLFRELEEHPVPPGAGRRFRAVPVAEESPHRLAIDDQGAATFLISCVPADSGRRPPPLELEHLLIQHHVQCRLLAADGTISDARYTIIRLDPAETRLRSHFLRFGGTLLSSIGTAPPLPQVQDAISAFLELFRALRTPARKAVQGFWAELFLVANAAEPRRLVEAWHADVSDRYDFNEGEQRIEVKSVQGRVRRHRFALEQLQPPAGTELVIASVLTETAGHGMSIRMLLDALSARLPENPEAQLRVQRVAADALGASLTEALDVGFDIQLARESLQFYSHEQIPSFDIVPAGISKVRFTVDLTSAPALSVTVLTGMVAAAVPIQVSS